MYETRSEPPILLAHFVRRLSLHFVAGLVFVLGSLALGMIGYEHFEKLDWHDAFVNAAMLLGGMGPVESPQTPGGKVFAGLYALYAWLVFLILAGVLLVPVIHRVLHHFHWDAPDGPRVCRPRRRGSDRDAHGSRRHALEHVSLGIERGPSAFTWFGGAYEEAGRVTFPNFAVEAEHVNAVYPDYDIGPGQMAAFLCHRDAAIGGRGTMKK